ncbi:MGMT family protein [Enterococcus sp. LJL120]
MANEDKKDFNAMLHKENDMPKIQIVTDPKVIARYGGEKMFFAPAPTYDAIMKKIPEGKLTTVSEIRTYLAEKNQADFTEPTTAGIFVSICAWASEQRTTDKTPYWRTLKANGELNPKYPGGIEEQKKLLTAEGHKIIQKGRKNFRYYVENYQTALIELSELL